MLASGIADLSGKEVESEPSGEGDGDGGEEEAEEGPLTEEVVGRHGEEESSDDEERGTKHHAGIRAGGGDHLACGGVVVGDRVEQEEVDDSHGDPRDEGQRGAHSDVPEWVDRHEVAEQ